VRVAIRTAGPIRGDASIKALDPIRRLGEIRTGARTHLPVLTRTAALIKRGDSTPVHAATKAARIQVDDSNRGRATNRGALIQTVGRTKALCETTSATALQRAPVPTPTATPLVVAIDPIAMVANVVAAEDAVADDAAVAAEAIARMRRRAEQLRDLARRLQGQETRSLRNRPPCRRVTVLITMKTPAMGTLGSSGSPRSPRAAGGISSSRTTRSASGAIGVPAAAPAGLGAFTTTCELSGAVAVAGTASTRGKC